MRVPLTWLRSYCDPGLPAAELAERLDMTGTEVERIEHVGVGSAGYFIIAKVLSAEQHPDADRLSVCQVDDGSGRPRTIVCGAPNVATGQTVAVALPGAVMPDGTELGEAELRGVRSSGMILAEDEVGIGGDHDGIMVLDEELPAGAPLSDALPIADEVLELEITPNRPDCLSVYGVAREVHAATGAELAQDPTATDAEPAGAGAVDPAVRVEIADPDICLRFTARVFEGVQMGPSPQWLKQRLTAAGQRPISNVVDITNYVMLCTGQPLHAFDLDEVRGSQIVVRRAEEGERMVTLDDVEREFTPDVALVCDAQGPSGVAGVMGGQISEVSEQTSRVLMEAATWSGPNILRTSKALGLRTEASARFEKQLHPDLAAAAQRLAAKLMVDLCGARMAPGTIDVYPEPLAPRVVTLRLNRIERLLGARIPQRDVKRILEALGFGVRSSGDAFDVAVPYWRDADAQREADLIEEIARIHGLEKLPITLPARERAVGRLTPRQRLRRRLEDTLRDRGLHEVVAWSFTSPEALARLRLAEAPPLALANPLSEDAGVMRPLLLPGLLDAAARNSARGAGGAGLFESAHVYAPDGPLDAPEGSPRGLAPAAERHHIAALLSLAAPAGWRSPARPADFYAAKGLVEALGAAAGLELAAEPGSQPFLHPGRSAMVLAPGGGEIGWIGELHPLVAGAWDLEGAAAFEVDFDALSDEAPGPAAYRDLASRPAVLQDIAVVAPEAVAAADVLGLVREAGGELLASARVFDVYAGEQVGEGNRSLAIRLEFRAPDRTLTDEEVAARRNAIESALGSIGGRLRG
ncbi:MAG: phenylalanine--tRNA ligase subunit beta [Thermoleophilaceae bacterium]|nr:phenylalanine--tRNA ligase subunit beta [Thermoleophilaceae bacterium]